MRKIFPIFCLARFIHNNKLTYNILQEKCLESANRWTDNIFNLEAWIKKKFPSLQPLKMFNIPEDIDYVENN